MCTFLLPMPFFQVNLHKYNKVCRVLCSVSHVKTCYSFSKICKSKIEFFTNIRMAKTAEKKNTQILRYNCSTKWPRKQEKKIVNLILENAMPKAITEVYFELLVTNFYAQISCNCHSKFVKIRPILMNRIASAVFVYKSFPASTKMFWLVTCPANSGQK